MSVHYPRRNNCLAVTLSPRISVEMEMVSKYQPRLDSSYAYMSRRTRWTWAGHQNDIWLADGHVEGIHVHLDNDEIIMKKTSQ